MHNSSCSTSSSFSVQGSELRTQALLLSLNALMLYGNMKQLAKLHVSTIALLVWIDVVVNL